MSITNQNFMASLAIITLVAAIAIYFGIREIQRTHGAETAVFLLLIIFIYFRHHSGTSMSETLGVPFGMLGIGLIWRGLEKRSHNLAIFGLFITALALNIRPGAMFTLPLILLWVGWILRKDNEPISLRFLLWGSIVIVFCFALNSLFIRILAGPSGTAFSNFSWALYGLTSGGNSFNYIFQQHPEVSLLHEPEQSRTIYRLALDLVIYSPDLLVKGVIHNLTMFFSNSWYSAYSFLEGENGMVYIITRWSIYILCILGFIKWLFNPKDPYSGLVAMATIGVLLSVPFVPPTDAYRVRLYAASIVIFGLLPSMGLSLIIELVNLNFFSQPKPELQSSNEAVVFGGLLIIMVLGGTLLAKTSSHPPPPLAVTCPPNEDKVAIRFNTNSSINILREKSFFLDWMPNFHYGLFRRSIHSLADYNLIEYFDELPAQTSIFSSLDYLSNKSALIIIPTHLLPQTGTYIGICGRWESDPKLKIFDLFYSKNVVIPIESE